MSSRFGEIERALRDAIAAMDVECMPSSSVRDFVRRMDRIERMAGGAKTVGIGELARKDAWNDGSARSAAEWVAKTTGAGWGEAKAKVALGEGLRDRHETTEALLNGEISVAQAALVSAGAAVDPEAEHRLLDLAQRSSVKELKAATDRIRAAEAGVLADQQAAVHRTRFLRTWVDGEGGFNIQARLTKAAGAKVLAALEPLMEVEFADARRQGRRESPDAYRADALVEMADRAHSGGKGEDAGPSAHIVVRVDYTALARGWVEGAEMCEIEHVGPVPVTEVDRLMADAFLTILRTTGTTITDASTMTRVVRQSLKRAVVERDRVCVVPTCGIAHGLEIDHLIPFAQGGPTSVDNLQRLCKHHHRLKTAGKAKLTRWETPQGPQFGWLPLTAEGCEPAGHADRTGESTTERVSVRGGRTGAAGGEPERTLWTA